MLPTVHPEVLANDWLPPVVFGRQGAVLEIVRRLDPPRPESPAPWMVGVAGPSGSGTSVVARRAARELADRWRSSGEPGLVRGVTVRIAGLRGSHGVATALLRRLDEGFDGRGFSTREILAGFLRRLRREGRAAVVVLDDLAPGAPELGPVLRAIAEPDRFLPEGDEGGLPPIWTVFAGTEAGLSTAAAQIDRRFSFAPAVLLEPYSEELLGTIVTDRAERALGRPLPPETVAEIVDRALVEGGGARRAIDLVRRAILGAPFATSLGLPRRAPVLGVVGAPSVVRAIGAASRGVAAPLGEVKRLEAELARTEGDRPLPTTTFWRRIVRLERAGYVRREIRTGGNGGTVSLVRLLTPIAEWVTEDRRSGTPRGFGPWSAEASEREEASRDGPASFPSWVSHAGAPG